MLAIVGIDDRVILVVPEGSIEQEKIALMLAGAFIRGEAPNSGDGQERHGRKEKEGSHERSLERGRGEGQGHSRWR